MTLTETLNFTGASDLPFLERDPVLQGAGAGAVLLLDAKNPFTWSPSLGGVIQPASPLRSLVRPAVYTAADGTSPGTGRWGNSGSTVNLNTFVAPININTTTGRMTFPASTYASNILQSTRTLTNQTLGQYLINGTSNYCMSIWVYHSGDATDRVMLHLGNGGTNSGTREGLRLVLKPATWQMWRHANTLPAAFPTNAGGNVSSAQKNWAFGGGSDQPGPTLSPGIHRLGYTWYKSGSIWRSQPITNQTVGTDLANTGFESQGIDLGQTTHDGARDNFWHTHIGGIAHSGAGSSCWGTNHALCRIYIENLSLSGRTAQQVWDADWARANGRFS